MVTKWSNTNIYTDYSIQMYNPACSLFNGLPDRHEYTHTPFKVWYPFLYYTKNNFTCYICKHTICRTFLHILCLVYSTSSSSICKGGFRGGGGAVTRNESIDLGTYRCNRLRCPLARFSGLQCFNMGHNGHAINLYGVAMILMGNLHAGGQSSLGHLSLVHRHLNRTLLIPHV